MDEWKGPWKCEKCGRILVCAADLHWQKVEGHHKASGRDGNCTGKLKPHDRRRAPDALVQAATRLLRACERADEDGDLPECVDGSLFDDLRAALKGVEDE